MKPVVKQLSNKFNGCIINPLSQSTFFDLYGNYWDYFERPLTPLSLQLHAAIYRET